MKDKFLLDNNPLDASTEDGDPEMQMELCDFQSDNFMFV